LSGIAFDRIVPRRVSMLDYEDGVGRTELAQA
jgi:hypothetical protein